MLEAISAGAADLNPASGSSDDSSEPSGSMSAVSDQDPKLLFPTDHHLGSGGLEGEGSDASATAASDARTAAVAAAANAKGAARHQRALGGLKTQAAMGGERCFHIVVCELAACMITLECCRPETPDRQRSLSQMQVGLFFHHTPCSHDAHASVARAVLLLCVTKHCNLELSSGNVSQLSFLLQRSCMTTACEGATKKEGKENA